MRRLLEGLVRFHNEVYPSKRELFESLAQKQTPHSLFITCSDSRIVPDLLTGAEPGDLFIIRNAGNIVPPYGEMNGGVSATIEYAIMALNIKNIVVCGHSDCGAMKAVLHPEEVADMPVVASWLKHAEVARRVAMANCPDPGSPELLRILTEENLLAQVSNLRTHPSVAVGLSKGDLTIYAWLYDIEQGRVRAFDVTQGEFVAVSDNGSLPIAAPQPRERVQEVAS